eukprot:14577385-Ditylum_brightwellii.AAC.1
MAIHCDITTKRTIKPSLEGPHANNGKQEEPNTYTSKTPSSLYVVRPCLKRHATICCGKDTMYKKAASSSYHSRRRSSVTFGQVE